jgi:hypothetical protein
MKLFTLDHRFVLRKAGKLAVGDASAVEAALASMMTPASASRAKRAP